jgi:hypothetical protein
VRISYLAPAFLAVVSCGGRELGSVRDGGSSSLDASTGDGGPDAGWSQCSAPGGLEVCRGPASCSTGSSTCSVCADDLFGMPSPPGSLSVCANPAWQATSGKSCGSFCSDGSICVSELSGAPDSFFCAPYDLGVLFAQNGASDRVRYADMATWTGAPLPIPSTCPPLSGIQICGADCGTCPQDEACTGRSPLHPYGFCGPPNSGPCDPTVTGSCPTGLSCFVFQVDAPAQAEANKYGLCVSSALCQSLATELPGGGKCGT